MSCTREDPAISHHHSVTTTMKLGIRVMELRDAHNLLRVTPPSHEEKNLVIIECFLGCAE